MNMSCNNVVSITPAAAGWRVTLGQRLHPVAAWVAYRDPSTAELHIVPAWPDGGRLVTPLDHPGQRAAVEQVPIAVDVPEPVVVNDLHPLAVVVEQP